MTPTDLKHKFQHTFICGFGMICGAWLVFATSVAGASVLGAAIVITVVAIGCAAWDFRGALKARETKEETDV